MTRFSLLLAALAVSEAASASGPAFAADPTGIWLSQDGDVKMKVARCGEAVCSTIFWLKEPNDKNGKPKTDQNNPDTSKHSRPIIGSPIILLMKADGTDKWSGQVYNAEDGKTYSGNLTFSGGNSLQLEGCALGGLVCKKQTWTKVN